jgi:signal transduction histidine kinase
LYRHEVERIEKLFRVEQNAAVMGTARYFQSLLRPVASDLRTFANGDAFRAYLDDAKPEDLEKATQQAVFLNELEPALDQIRYLDSSGHELIRVDRGPQVVPFEALQDKSDRPYFKKASSLGRGQIYLSAFDLNVENGQLERPLKPMVRFSMPVFDSEGVPSGVVAINYRCADLLSRLQDGQMGLLDRLRVLNDRGYWLKGRDPKDEWGFMFPERRDATLARTNPPLWEKLRTQETGQVQNEGGVFTWRRVNLREISTDTLPLTLTEDEYVIIASEVSQADFSALLQRLRIVFGVLTPLLVISALLVGRFFVARRKAYDELRQSRKDLADRALQLEEANRELDAFSYSVSHDLRAPLRHIQGYVNFLHREVEGTLSDKGRRYLETIKKAGKQMGDLIDDLLAFSQMGRAKMRETTVDLNVAIREAREGVTLKLQGREVVWDILELPLVRGDAGLLRSVLANLIGNAVKYSRIRKVARIEIGTSGMEEDRIVFFVRDNGAGFDMKYAGRLFGVFQRLHGPDEFEGTGIGLANVRRIVSRHGGRTWAEGKVDEGATFYFTLFPATRSS